MEKYEKDMILYNRACMYIMKDKFIAGVAVWVQFLVAFGIEFLSFLIICSAPTVEEVVMNYVAIAVVVEIDEILASITSNRVQRAIQEDVDS